VQWRGHAERTTGSRLKRLDHNSVTIAVPFADYANVKTQTRNRPHHAFAVIIKSEPVYVTVDIQQKIAQSFLAVWVTSRNLVAFASRRELVIENPRKELEDPSGRFTPVEGVTHDEGFE